MNKAISLENTPTLKTCRLILRRFNQNDAAALLAILSDPEANTFLPWLPLKNLVEAVLFLEKHFLSYYTKPAGYRYAVCLKDNLPIGYIWLAADDSNDLGFGLRRDMWHQGITTEAARAVVKRLRSAGIPFLTATHDINNPNSGKVMQKIGMQYKYSYIEQWQPKDISVTFRMYQLDLAQEKQPTYMKYWDMYPDHFIEDKLC